MKQYQTEDIRNIVVVGHGSEGKTTLVESMLFASGAIDRAGRVEDGNTVSDFDAEEIRRGISISAVRRARRMEGHEAQLRSTCPATSISSAK